MSGERTRAGERLLPTERPLPTDPADAACLELWEALRRRLELRVGDEGGERGALAPLEPYDFHTHIGHDDPDGFTNEPEELLGALAEVGAGALTFPMHEPSGYRAANDRVLELAAGEERIDALCRVDPTATGLAGSTDAVSEAERCLDRGARGIKLHPRAEGFSLAEPAVERLLALAHERSAIVLIHAGRGIPALGQEALRLADSHPQASIVLAHAAISDLAWIGREVEAGSNLFCDTSWWSPADLIALLRSVPTSQILWASDAPYGRPLGSALTHLRCAIEAGVSDDGSRAVAGGNARQLLAGVTVAPIAAPREPMPPLDRDLERVYLHLVSAFGYSNGGADPSEQVALARLACEANHSPEAEVLGEVDRLLQRVESELLPAPRTEHRYGALERLLVAAMTVARTPSAGGAAPSGPSTVG